MKRLRSWLATHALHLQLGVLLTGLLAALSVVLVAAAALLCLALLNEAACRRTLDAAEWLLCLWRVSF